MTKNMIINAYLIEITIGDHPISEYRLETKLDLVTQGDADNFSEYVDIVSTAIRNIRISDSPRFIVLSILRLIFIETGLMLSRITGNPFWADPRLIHPIKTEEDTATILANIHNLYEQGEVIHAADDDTD